MSPLELASHFTSGSMMPTGGWRFSREAIPKTAGLQAAQLSPNDCPRTEAAYLLALEKRPCPALVVSVLAIS